MTSVMEQIRTLKAGMTIDVKLIEADHDLGHLVALPGETMRMVFEHRQLTMSRSSDFTNATSRNTMENPMQMMIWGMAIYEDVPEHIHQPPAEQVVRANLRYGLMAWLIESIEEVR